MANVGYTLTTEQAGPQVLPEVQASSRLKPTVPLGDAESLERLRERTEDAVTRPAGSTALVDADIPSTGDAGPDQEPGGKASGA